MASELIPQQRNHNGVILKKKITKGKLAPVLSALFPGLRGKVFSQTLK